MLHMFSNMGKPNSTYVMYSVKLKVHNFCTEKNPRIHMFYSVHFFFAFLVSHFFFTFMVY